MRTPQTPVLHPTLLESDSTAIPVVAVHTQNWSVAAARFGPLAEQFAKAQDFKGKDGNCLCLPDADGRTIAVLFGLGESLNEDGVFAAGRLPNLLPAGQYRLDSGWPDPELAVLAFALGSYRFTRYKHSEQQPRQLVVPEGVDGEAVSAIAKAVFMGRDLINTPANDMGPQEIEDAACALADQFCANICVIRGDDLLEANYPMIHAVGRASTRPPRLIDLVWGQANHPKVTLIGKGVAFDTGGLNIKPDASMLLMKKDMGGAATALTAASMIMAANLPVRLRVLIPAVENAISGSAFRPGDVLASRKGLSVEIGNTDAEGRLVLADALALADEDKPELVLQYATLTGAARVALGPDLPPFYTKNDALAEQIMQLGREVHDPVWRLPLWNRYRSMLDSRIADINHVSSGGFAGSITAALFLDRFCEQARDYVHFDIFGWTPSARPGRSEGGEPQAARLTLALLQARYGQ